MIKPLFLTTIFLFLMTACENKGTKMKFNNGYIYFKEGITEEQAVNTGRFLFRQGYFPEKESQSVQIEITNQVFKLRIASPVTPKNDSASFKNYTLLAFAAAAEISNQKPVEIEICDDKFKTLQTYRSSEFKMKNLKKLSE